MRHAVARLALGYRAVLIGTVLVSISSASVPVSIRAQAVAKPPVKPPVSAPAKTPSATKKAAPTKASTHPSAIGAAALASSLEEAISTLTKSGHWGAMVVSLTHGDTLYAHDADAPMAPASTMKMFTAAVSLDRFGPDHVFKTPVLHDGTVDSDGVVHGNVYLRGVGDPSLSIRFWKSDSPIDALARLVAGTGIKRIDGDVVGDATAFDGQLIPNGWKTSYLGAAYAARVASLTVNEGLIWIVVQPSGKTAAVTLDPATATVPVISTVRVVPGSGGSISASRNTDGAIVVKGTIGANASPRRYSIVADNPPVYVAGALRSALEKAGITVTGTVRMAPTPGGAIEIAAITSPPLSQIIGEMDRESINVVAEMLFRDAAATPTQVGSATTGLANLRQFLGAKVGVRGDMVDVYDGSGLSELDRLTARSMVALLGYAHASPWSAAFHASLPVEGESGTLKNRDKGTTARGNLHAKTGTTNTVAALGGYVTARDGEILAFSFLYNGADRWNAKTAMDHMGVTMAEWVREPATRQ